jgi:hypothetical protein
MPAALVECGFMDNPHDAVLLRSELYRKECAIELTKGLCEVFGVRYQGEEEAMEGDIIYNKLTELPDYAREPIQALINHGLLFGDDTVNLGIRQSELKCLVVSGRMTIKQWGEGDGETGG